MRNRSGANRKLAIKEAEKVLGKKLPPFAVVHHVDEDEANIEHTNLVVCEDQKYHFLLHQRTDALKACGYANWRRCKFCGEYDDPNNLYISKQGVASHRKCQRECCREYFRQYHLEKKQMEAINQFLINLKKG